MKPNTFIAAFCSHSRMRWISLALGLGTAFGTALGNFSVGAALGLGIALALGATRR